jgi:drug/metabolite transporter (DMT)-like permease
MTAIVFALAASGVWGVADFFAGVKSRSHGVLTVLVVGQLAGLSIASVLAAAAWNAPPQRALFAIPAAVTGTLGLFAFLKAMAVGAISLVTPLVSLSAAVPVVFGVATGDDLSWAQAAGIALAVGGAFFAAVESVAEEGGRRSLGAGVGLAIVAALAFGSYFPFMDAAADDDLFWAVLVFRLTSSSIVVTALLGSGTRLTARTAVTVTPLVLIGVGDVAGIAFFGAASQSGLVSVVSVLSSLYPVIGVLLAAFLLRERLTGIQWAGVAAVFVGVALISAG